MKDLGAWNLAFTDSLGGLWYQTISFLPTLLVAILVLIAGIIIASSLGKLAKKLIEITPLEKMIGKTGFTKKMGEAGVKFSFSRTIGWLVKWFLIIVVILTVTNVLGLTVISTFLTGILWYIPNVIIAVVLLVIGIVVGEFVHKVVVKSVTASRIIETPTAGFLAGLAKWTIVVFAFMAALSQLEIAKELIEILFAGIVVMLSIAGGLAFGLGGKKKAAQWLNQISKKGDQE